MGATKPVDRMAEFLNVSIHAPVMGATFDMWQAETRDFLQNKRDENDSVRHQDFLDYWPVSE